MKKKQQGLGLFGGKKVHRGDHSTSTDPEPTSTQSCSCAEKFDRSSLNLNTSNPIPLTNNEQRTTKPYEALGSFLFPFAQPSLFSVILAASTETEAAHKLCE